MFGIRKTREKNEYLREFLNGYTAFLYPAFNSMGSYDKKEMQAFADACARLIEDSSPREISDILNCLRLRPAAYTYYDRPSGKGGHSRLCQEEYPALAAVGMFSSDGYCRMDSCNAAADIPSLLPLLMFRINDWVPEVRKAAVTSAGKTLSSANAFDIIRACATAEKVCRNRDNNNAFDEIRYAFRQRISEKTSLVTMRRLLALGEKERRDIYRTIINGRLIEKPHARFIAEHEEKNMLPFVMLLMMNGGYYSHEELLKLTYSPYPQIRVRAAVILTENEFPRELCRLLIDDNKAVRDTAAFGCIKHSDVDIASYCRKHFPAAGAIRGYGERMAGRYEQAARIMPYTASQDAKTAAAALYALSMMTGDRNDSLYYDMIADPRSQVRNAAYKAFWNCGGYKDYGRIYEDILKYSDIPAVSRRYAKLLCRRGGNIWHAMPYLIRLYDHPDESIRTGVRAAVQRVPDYFTATEEAGRKILDALDVSKAFPPKLADIIRKTISHETDRLADAAARFREQYRKMR